MKKRTRILVALMSLVAALVVAFVAALPGIVALNKVKNEIAETLSKASGRPVTIGRLSLSLYPWLGIRLDGARIANAPSFGSKPLAQVDDALVEVRVLPLFAGHVVLRRVVVTGLRLNLRENAAGQTNWAFLVRPPKTPPVSTKAARAEEHEAPAFVLLRAAGLTVTNASVQYHNARTGAHDVLSHFAMRLGTIVPGHPVAVHLAGEVQVAGHGPFPFRFSARAIHQHKGLLLNPLRFSIATLKVLGTVQARETSSGLKAHGHLQAPVFAPRPLLAALGLHYTPSDPKALQSARGQVAFTLSPGRLSLAPLTIEFDKTLITGRLLRLSRPRLYRLHLAINSLALAPYLPKKPPSPPAAAAGSLPTKATSSAQSAHPSSPLSGTVTIGRLVVHGLTLTHVFAGIQSHVGRLSLRPLMMDLYGGTLAGQLAAKTMDHPLSWQLQARLLKVHIGALLRAAHMFPEFSGSMNARTDVYGVGTSLVPIERSLSGTLSASMPRGVLRGLDIDFIAKNPKAVVGAQRVKKVSGTVFTRLHAQAAVANGVVSLQALILHTARAVVRGQGTITLLPSKTVNTLLNVSLPSGLTIPVHVRGPVGHIHFAVSLNRLLNGSGKGLGSALKSLGGRLKSFLGIH